MGSQMADEANLCDEDSTAVGTGNGGRCPWLQGLFLGMLYTMLNCINAKYSIVLCAH